jgi:hypothetical protein
MVDWMKTSEVLPDDGMVVNTKIHDEKGCRNEGPLKRRGNLWFVEDGSMYVYYRPTHWRPADQQARAERLRKRLEGMDQDRAAVEAELRACGVTEAPAPQPVAWMTKSGFYPNHDCIPARDLPPLGNPVPLYTRGVEGRCGSHECKAAQQDGVLCADGECDRENGVRPSGVEGTPAAKLTVWFGAMPESNGKANWTAILHRGDLSEGYTIERSEHHDRVRYEADRVRWLIGETGFQPDILMYDADMLSPPGWGHPCGVAVTADLPVKWTGADGTTHEISLDYAAQIAKWMFDQHGDVPQVDAVIGGAMASQPSPTMQGLADWLRAYAANLLPSEQGRRCIEQWAREVDAARGVKGPQ